MSWDNMAKVRGVYGRLSKPRSGHRIASSLAAIASPDLGHTDGSSAFHVGTKAVPREKARKGSYLSDIWMGCSTNVTKYFYANRVVVDI